MPIEFGKRLNPSWDALRARTLAGLSVLDSAQSIIGGGVENKIYVWHADASTLDVFDPTATGLNTALTIAAAGDTVWCPSINIPVTAAQTVPASVALIGISHNAALTFTGFNGTAITLSASSIIANLTISYTSSGSTEIVIDAEASECKVLLCEISFGGNA